MPRKLTDSELKQQKLADVRAVCDAEFSWVEPEVEAAEGESKLKKFSITAYTGVPVRVGFGYPVVVDLAGMTIAGDSLPILKDHDATKIVGHTDSHDKSLKRLKLTGVVSGVGEAASEVTALGANGFPWQASIGASIEEMQFIDKGESVNVNGRSISGPVYLARKSTLRETSFVAIGADAGTSGRIAAQHHERKTVMDPELKAFIEAKGFDPTALSDVQIAGLKASLDAEKKAASPAPSQKENKSVDDLLSAMKAEAERKEEIGQLLVAACEGRTRDEMIELRKIHDSAIDAKWDKSRSQLAFQLAALQMGRGGNSVAIHIGGNSSAPPSADVLEAAVAMSANVPNIEKHFKPEVLEAAHKRFRSRIGLKQLYRICAKANGWRGEDDSVTKEMHNFACGYTSGPMMQAGFSSFAVPGILSNVAGKSLQEGWGGGDMTWREVTKFRNVSDFKQVSSYKLSGNFKYIKVGGGGELTHGTVSEDTYTNQAETYGRMFALTRTDIINDDLGAVSQIPTELGFGANDAFNEVFWTEFLADQSTFFAAGNNNTSSGVWSSAAIASLIAAELVFMNQTKPNGTPLGIMPDRILVPPGTKRYALAAMESTQVVGSTGPTPDANTFANNYRVLSTPYIANSAYTGYSTVKWYMLANPARLAMIETAFLDGREAPIIETADAAFNVLGVQMRAYHDFGCNKQEYRAAVQGSGA